MMARSNVDLLRRAHRALPGASFGTYYLPDGVDFVVGRGHGSRVYDVEGNEYLDYVLASGPMILGHVHPAVVEAVKAQIENGSSYYALNEPAIVLAEKLIAAVPCAEAVKFCASGGEATFYALRLARAITGREKIIKFEGGYHGHHDYGLMSVTPTRLVPFPEPVPDSAGIPRLIRSEVLVAPFNDLEETLRILQAHRETVAALIVEPQCRLIDPKPGFLEGLREATQRLGVMLIFDELVTGFRLAYGGAQEFYGVTPDLACYGKIIGGGYPLAAVVGRREILELANPRKKGSPDYAYVSGTLNGNAVAATAGLATIGELEKGGVYERLRAAGDRLRRGLGDIALRLDIPGQVAGAGPLANIFFTPEPILDYRSAMKADSSVTQQLTREMLRRGVLANFASKMYISLAHSDADIDHTLQAVEDSLRTIRKR
jgi:glutamate-1-semialdehyde 2,1-aminomutase